MLSKLATDTNAPECVMLHEDAMKGEIAAAQKEMLTNIDVKCKERYC